MPIIVTEKDKTHFELTDESFPGFSAAVVLNPRDAMVFVKVKQLPEGGGDQEAIMRAMHDCLQKQFGGKIVIELPSGILSVAQAAGSR